MPTTFAIYYGIYLVNNETVVRIPINPIDEYTIDTDTANSTYDVLSIGEITIPRTPLPKSIEWSTFFPRESDAYYVVTKANFREPQYYINYINNIMNNKTPIRLIINRYYEDGQIIFDDNLMVTVESFQVKEIGGETGDFYYTIRLKEYRDFSPILLNFENISTDPLTNDQVIDAIKQNQRDSSYTNNVGDNVFVNGPYFSDPEGSARIGNLSNTVLEIGRIILNPESNQRYTYYIVGYGWVESTQIRKSGLYDYS